MAFNWFRRQNESSEVPADQTEGENPAIEENPTETAAQNPVDTTDLLAYAKAAYKNIQQKQQIQTSSEAETTTAATEAQVEAPPATEEPTVEEVTPTDVAENPETVVVEEVAENIEPIVSAEQPTSPANLSFLERAAAERQARQERLEASAIEVTEPETTTPETIVEIPELEFDDGFVWSAEVLAAQGRKAEDISIEEITWLKKLRQGLDKTRRNLLNQLKALVGQGPLNQAAVSEIEALLLQADVGVEATDDIIEALQNKLREEVTPPEQAIAYLKTILREMLDAPVKNAQRPSIAPDKENLNIWLMTGVNGAGKTTTIGKIAHLAQKSGYNCLIGAADTFRAAAVQQVQVWGERSGVEVIANPGKNTDPAAVVFDAIAAAQSRNTELLLIDTAGRLQNKKNLMDELSKVRKIIDKKAPNARVESLLVLDATLGQNGLRQAQVFSEAAQLSGVVLTKLDGTAKGGVALAVVKELGLPIRFIGAGEGIEDLRPFSSYEFVEALLSG
ncbi:MAG TPA: signal recognition particle-docking protein FtsY [Nostocaceae cyanobacterium]|nr:signal recognition particle-docking protein FtsY [Nostocaceae cyanobacterium]